MRLIITGATGNVGTALLHRLRAGSEDHELVGVARRPPAQVPPYDGLQWHAIDVAHPDAVNLLRPVFEGADAVIHLVWAFQPTHDRNYLRRVGVDGTLAVATAAEAAGVAHLVHMSSGAVYSPARGRTVDESAPREGVQGSVYSVDKAAAEAGLDAFEEDSSVVVARVRPGFIGQQAAGSELGRYTLPRGIPAGVLKFLPLLPLDRSLAIPAVHADDVADALTKIVFERATGAYNLSVDPPLGTEEFGAALHARPVHVPRSLLALLIDATWRVHAQPIHRGWIDLAYSVPLLDSARARRELHWEPRYSAQETLDEAVRGFIGGDAGDSPVLRRRSPFDGTR
ncbi:NAD-dependent epimerase/dehydratase family protein [Rhodococcus tibetensis]|uniref:NAD-dependent epimerase/dehydratase family protein n=1 Tax=Rhodococcus tibetensis TaxID=2965064 RepID=A0ABT1QN42_9NOCA|nr:NAD-dependent epimerase/dehydratase family protein [Rhodococcus sp. FXJ9.536]MCQ4122517.1 NAD-dependent epimerase/dehydratase family protein [Rhodococcus sp. FXJ9.536]